MSAVTNEDAVGLPSLSIRRKPTWDYYRLEFLADGYPGRRSREGLHAHPIYGPYVINDYLGQHRLTGREEFLHAARRVADAAVERMVDFHGALIFQYLPNTGVSSLPQEFYSGLTQSRYLSTLGKLEVALGSDRYAAACSGILRSLQLPAEIGGIARRTPHDGLLIEEYSHSVPDYTLNGWTTATTLVHQYAAATQDEEAQAVFEDSVRGIVDVLPLFDLPELANSRYRLTGPARLRLVFSQPGASIQQTSVVVPGQGTYPLGRDRGKWRNQYVSGLRAGGRVARCQAVMEVLLCRISWPQENRLTAELTAPRAGRLQVQIGQGPYDPLSNWLRAESYATVADLELAKGRNLIDVAIPWVDAELIAYPTSFTKPIAGKQYNSYHFIHIDTLTTLADITGHPTLAHYRDTWGHYPQRWAEMPIYADADIVLERYKAPSTNA